MSEPEQTGITPNDLSLVLQIIQASSARGAFKADELAVVGGLYDRIFKFLESIGVIVRDPVEATTESDEKPTTRKGKAKS